MGSPAPGRDRSALAAVLAALAAVIMLVGVVTSATTSRGRATPAGTVSVSDAADQLVERGVQETDRFVELGLGDEELAVSDFSLHNCRGYDGAEVFSINLGYRLAVTEDNADATMAQIRRNWLASGHDVERYDGETTSVKLVESEDPRDGLKYTASLNHPGTAVNIRIRTPCYENPSPGSFAYHVNAPPGWDEPNAADTVLRALEQRRSEIPSPE